MLTLKEYRNLIDLGYVPKPMRILDEKEKSAICDEMLAVLLE